MPSFIMDEDESFNVSKFYNTESRYFSSEKRASYQNLDVCMQGFEVVTLKNSDNNSNNKPK